MLINVLSPIAKSYEMKEVELHSRLGREDPSSQGEIFTLESLVFFGKS